MSSSGASWMQTEPAVWLLRGRGFVRPWPRAAVRRVGLPLAGLSVLSAHAFTTEKGIALDLFEVRGAFEDDVDDRRWDRFRMTLQDALAGGDLGEKVRSLRSHYRPAGTDVPVTVNVDQ